MILRIIKTLAYIFVISAISFTIVYLLNKGNLDIAQKEVRVVTSETYNEELKNSIEIGAVVKVTGAPDLLKQVSQEPKEQTDDTVQAQYYYVSLKEYGNDMVVRISPGKLKAESQTFEGKVTQLSDTPYGTRIKNSLNNPLNFDDAENQEAAGELDQDSKNLIAESSKADFSNETFLVLDGEILDSEQIVLGIALWTSVLALFLITLLRKKVFQMR